MRTIVHYVDGDEVGGTERVALQLLCALDRHRWRPLLFHHGAPGLAQWLAEVSAAGVETRVVPRIDRAHHLGRMPAFVRALRMERPSVLHAHLSWPLSCKYGLVAATLARVPVVVATAQLYFDVSALPVVAMQPPLLAKMVDRYFAVSNVVAGQLEHEFRIPARKIQIARNGIDLSLFTGARDARLRAELTCDSDRPLVLTVARLDRQKGLPDLVDAAAQTPQAVFVVAGEGSDRAALEARARERGVADRVRFIGARQDVPALLAAADLFVLPSLYEGLPLSVMEAMAAGTPVVATAIGGTDELVTPGETGLLVPPGEPQALASAIRTVLDDPGRARSLAGAARVRAQREFGFDHVAARVAASYDELLAGRP